MAEILLHLPRALSADQVVRLTEDLEAAHGQGRELGSRMPHIRVGAEQLMPLSGMLQNALDELDQTLSVLQLHDCALTAAVQSLVDRARMLANTAPRHSSVT